MNGGLPHSQKLRTAELSYNTLHIYYHILQKRVVLSPTCGVQITSLPLHPTPVHGHSAAGLPQLLGLIVFVVLCARFCILFDYRVSPCRANLLATRPVETAAGAAGASAWHATALAWPIPGCGNLPLILDGAPGATDMQAAILQAAARGLQAASSLCFQVSAKSVLASPLGVAIGGPHHWWLSMM